MTPTRSVTFAEARRRLRAGKLVYLHGHNGDYTQVLNLRKSGPEIWIDLVDGRGWRERREAVFYVRRAK